MVFDGPEESVETKGSEIELEYKTWWLGKWVKLKVTGPARNILEFTQKYVPVGKAEKDKK